MKELKNVKSDEGKLQRELGLFSVVLFIYGYVVGVGVLIQSGVTAAITGPMLWLAFVIAAIPAIINAIIFCYVGSAFPVSGGAWVYSSRLGSPFLGMLVVATVMLNVMGGLALVALGFGIYFEIFIPNSFLIVAILILIVFYLINLFGIKFTGAVQVILVIFGDLLVIFIFIIFGLPNIKPGNFIDSQGGLFPTGIIGILMGVIILNFSYQGYTSVIEIGGEIKNPRRNIPLALIISFILICTVYILIAIVMVGVMDWRTLGRIEGTVVDVAALFFPSWMLLFLSILILVAIASTIHAILLAYSRNLFSAARDCLLPSFISKLNKRFNTPHWSLTIFTVGALLLLFFQANVIDLSIVTSFTGSISGLIIAYLPIKLEEKYPELMKNSRFKLKRKVLIGFIAFNFAYAILSILLMAIISPMAVIISVIFYAGALIYYFIRKRWLAKRGIDLREICKTIPEEALEV
ncbi:MAG: amino acid permease [Candidatus Lokiarchaeota archaeon]|nr:amino acid permease [Candidatus Lokiarchaeota archaeon]MBD3339028.1 amino acid permease [Candidatus Lokiarchaeota archaeon]